MDAFLTRDERRQIQRVFDKWNKFANCDDLLPMLYSRHLLTERDREEYRSKRTLSERNEYIFDALLMRGTYNQLCLVKSILEESGNGSHLELASMLPARQETPMPTEHIEQSEPMDTGIVLERSRCPYQHSPNEIINHQEDIQGQGSHTSSTHSSQQRQNQTQATTDTQAHAQAPTQAQPQQDNAHTQSHTYNSHTIPETDPPDHVPFMASRYNVKTEEYQKHVQRTPVDPHRTGLPTQPPIPNPHTVLVDPVPEELSTTDGPRLGYYPVRSNHQQSSSGDHVDCAGAVNRHGQGLCVVLANFTRELDGYLNDIKQITGFFRGKLRYRTMGCEGDKGQERFRNLTTEDFKARLMEVQTYINDPSICIDRLFIFVLSHGDEFGIKMRAPDSQDNSVRDRMKSHTITDMFNHNQVPGMKGLPKCFFMQVCRGEELARAAGHSIPAGEPDYSQYIGNRLQPEIDRPKAVALGADTLVCHAAKEGKYSWVVDTRNGETGGSWFIQATMDVFKKYYVHEHVLDMMTEVNERVSVKMGRALVKLHGDTKSSIVVAHQLPLVCNHLTKKLYL